MTICVDIGKHRYWEKVEAPVYQRPLLFALLLTETYFFWIICVQLSIDYPTQVLMGEDKK